METWSNEIVVYNVDNVESNLTNTLVPKVSLLKLPSQTIGFPSQILQYTYVYANIMSTYLALNNLFIIKTLLEYLKTHFKNSFSFNNKDGVRTSVHYYHYAKNSVPFFPQSSVLNFMRDRPLFLHSSTWYLAHGVSHSSHTQSGSGS